MNKIHQISAEHLSIEQIGEIIKNGIKLELSEDVRQRIIRCREYLDNKIKESETPIYGVTTGFGSLCKVSIDKDSLSQLQKSLVMSHACGIGDRVSNKIVKIMLLLKIQLLNRGYSACQLKTVERLIDFFNNDIYPIVYMQGSLGASGDFVPLAHLSLPLIGMGEVEYKDEIFSGAVILKKMKWEAIELISKEGLALLNGAQNMNASAVWALLRSGRLSEWADVIGTMSLEAYDGRIEPFTRAVHAARHHKGQIDTAARIKELLGGGELIKQSKVNVQDPYSFRCISQVHGALKDTIAYVKSVADIEVSAATDNPTACPSENLVIPVGNFHEELIAQPVDFLVIALCELSNISKRRIYRLVSGTRNLPSFLVAKPGADSSFMIPQYTAASIVSQSKTYCTPASVDSIPSSQGQEDHISMGANAATKLYQVVLNTERVLAVEPFSAAQVLEFRRPLKSSPMIEAIHKAYHESVPFIDTDEFVAPRIAKSVEFLRK